MTSFSVRSLSADVSVAPQLGPEDMAWAAQQGFKTVVNNRPDFEAGPDQPTNASIEVAAKEAGLAYAYLPVDPNYQTPEEVACFADLLASMPKPILAFCRSGNRSGRLFHQASMLE